MDQERSAEQRLKPRSAKRWKVALALVGMTAASLTMASEASAATIGCKPTATVTARTTTVAKNCGVQTLGVRW